MEFVKQPKSIILGLIVIVVLVAVIIIIFTQTGAGKLACFFVAEKFEIFFFGFKPFTQICKLVVRV